MSMCYARGWDLRKSTRCFSTCKKKCRILKLIRSWTLPRGWSCMKWSWLAWTFASSGYFTQCPCSKKCLHPITGKNIVYIKRVRLPWRMSQLKCTFLNRCDFVKSLLVEVQKEQYSVYASKGLTCKKNWSELGFWRTFQREQKMGDYWKTTCLILRPCGTKIYFCAVKKFN